ncbi:MAG: helix-turn-helix transcriptional regulator [Ruminococcus sp.]|nr:helix-turn-helix transcriptional regulator [Ruminococcus sp.]
MASFAGKDLRLWRKMEKISANELAEKVNCDVSTIYHFEAGEVRLNPDTMYEICFVLGDVSRWCDWMQTEYPTSYGKVHPEIPQYDMSGALMSLYVSTGDLQDIEREVMRDCADGKIDDVELRGRLAKTLAELVGKAQLLLNIMNCDKEKMTCQHRSCSSQATT